VCVSVRNAGGRRLLHGSKLPSFAKKSESAVKLEALLETRDEI